MRKLHRIIKNYFILKMNILIFLLNHIMQMLKILLSIKLLRAQLFIILVLILLIPCWKINLFAINQRRWFLFLIHYQSQRNTLIQKGILIFLKVINHKLCNVAEYHIFSQFGEEDLVSKYRIFMKMMIGYQCKDIKMNGE